MLHGFTNFLTTTGFTLLTWQMPVMWAVAGGLLWLAMAKGFKPWLLVPIAFGSLLANLPTRAGVDGGWFDFISQGVKLEMLPLLILLGIGTVVDLGPLIAVPRTLLVGVAAQLGMFATFMGAGVLGFTSRQAASVGMLGGADGPAAIFLSGKLSPELLGSVVVAACSCLVLVPLIQPPIMRLLTTDKERRIHMQPLRSVSRQEKLIFSLVVMVICSLLVPDASPLIAMLMLGNLLREWVVAGRLDKACRREIINILMTVLGVGVGVMMTAERFLTLENLKILTLGVVASGFSTVGGVLMAKLMNAFSPGNPVNPLIGSAGVSALPMAARVSQAEGQKYDASNHLLMHAMGPNVAGVIGTAVAAGYFLSTLGR